MILVTGSAGYIGSEVCKKLESLKYDYIGIDDLSGTSKKNIFNKKKFKWVPKINMENSVLSYLKFLESIKDESFIFKSY